MVWGWVWLFVLYRFRFAGSGDRWPYAACVIALGAGMLGLRALETPNHQLARVVFPQGNLNSGQRVPIEVRGVLLDSIMTEHALGSLGDPPVWPSSRTSVLLGVDRVRLNDVDGQWVWARASGMVRVLLGDGRYGGIDAGDRVELLGLFSASGHARNPGDLDWESSQYSIWSSGHAGGQ